ncbi:hypothetical protein PW52_03305 [Tamlana sedimentorum]|uniref:Uncharacterized protein n=1 Tax=Neotamlana sedimentorum TaxID=1435349 RepID=A0A0D7WDA7_9FLAO|nr:hypothetical protein [Tamlana sedimentorum]KJD36683.1 hypothetical protein PW52_03305 [Tamlana sedimentorum]
MEVKFDLVRIGKFRKDRFSEKIIEENADSLRTNIKSFLKNETCSHRDNTVHMTIVIPAKGYNVKMVLQDIRDFKIRKQLRERFPNFIYKGNQSTLLENLSNRIWRT